MKIHLLRYVHGGERMASHDVVQNVFLNTIKNAKFHVSGNKPMSFCPLSYNLRIIESTLCYWSMVSTHCQMLSSLTPLKLIWFHSLLFLMGLWWQSWLKQRMIFQSQSIPNGHVSPSSYRGFQMSSLISKWVFSLLCQHGM
jgi:hypothetical protein